VNQGNKTETRISELSTRSKYCKAWSKESGKRSSIYNIDESGYIPLPSK